MDIKKKPTNISSVPTSNVADTDYLQKNTKSSRMSSGESSSSNKNSKRVVLIVVMIVATVVIAVAGIFAYRYFSSRVTIAQVNSLNEETSQLVQNEDYTQAISKWQDLLKKPMNKNVQCLAQLKYANTLQDSGRYKTANDYYKEVQSNCKNYDEFELYIGLARSYDGLNDISKAVEYYQRGVDIEKQKLQNPANDQNSDQIKENIDNNTQVIDELKASS